MGRGPGVRATGPRSIQIDFRYKGIRCRERLSLAPTPANLKYAARLKATIDHEIATQTFDYAKHFPESPRAMRLPGLSTPLRQALLDYCAGLEGQLQPETVDEYRHDAEIVAQGLKGEAIETLTRAKVRSWVSTLNLTKKRIDNLLIPLRGALNQAVEDGKITASPLAGFRVRRVERPRETIDPFTPEEVRLLQTTALGDIWGFWAWTGLRSGELIGLQFGDIAPDCGQAFIRRAVRVGREKITKTSSGERRINLLRPAQEIIQRLASHWDGMDPTEAVFRNPNTGERWHEDRGLARAFRKACTAAEVRYRYPYQLRHTYATWALSSGENPAWIARQMGHSDTMMLFRVYGKWMPSMDPEAGSRMVKAAKRKAA